MLVRLHLKISVSGSHRVVPDNGNAAGVWPDREYADEEYREILDYNTAGFAAYVGIKLKFSAFDSYRY